MTARLAAWGTLAGAVLGVGVLVARPLYVSLFTPDDAVQHALSAALVVVAVLQPVAGAVFVLDGVLIRAGEGRYLAAAGVLTLGAFVPAALLAGSLVELWWAYGVFMLARLATLATRAVTDAWLVTGSGVGARR